MTYTYLFIPERFRKTREGRYTFCNKCNKNYTEKCGLTGKRIHTCAYPEAHRYQSKKDATKKHPKIYKTWPENLRDLDEFFKLHKELVKNTEQSKTILLNDQPGLLLDCMKMYGDFIQDIDVNSYEKKENSDKYIKGQLNNLRHFLTALREQQIEPSLLPVTELGEVHANIIHDYLNKYEASTYNNIIADLRSFIEYLIDKDYPIKNIFLKIRYKPENTNTEIVSMEEFEQLLEICTPENGLMFEKKGGGRFGTKQVFRSYTKDIWRYALYTGCRREEIENARVSDDDGDHIKCTDYKVSNKQRIIKVRWIPRTLEVIELRQKIIKENNLSGDNFLFEPTILEKRAKIPRMASVAFSHYWKQISDRKIRMYDLRNTYASYMLEHMGEKFSGKVGLHAKLITTLKKYANDKKVLSEMNGRKVYG